jgi:hypothetical protein
LLRQRNVQRYLEIGTRHGDAFHAVVSSLPAGATGVAVDMPGGPWGHPHSRKFLMRAIADLNHRGYWCSALFGDSHTLATRQLIQGRGPFDAILIDGDHTLDGVTTDWELYGKMAPLVAFHDIAGVGQMERRRGHQVEVPVLWSKIKQQAEVREFIAPDSRMGIGCVFT